MLLLQKRIFENIPLLGGGGGEQKLYLVEARCGLNDSLAFLQRFKREKI